MKMLFSKSTTRAIIRLFLAISFYLASAIQINAQQKYPVTVSVNITPPYSVYLTDYISPGSNKLVANLVFNDYNEPSWDVYLRIKIESSNLRITSRTDFVPLKPITLTPGIPVQISGEQFYQYFDYNNIDVAGISKAELISNGRLIEGNYKFSVEVYDYNKHVPLSLESFAYANILLNDPPRLVVPNDQAVVELSSSNINFQWQLPSGNIASVLYQLSIYELGDYNVNPSVAIKNNQAVKVFESEQLENPLYLYNINSPLLQRGKKYAWLVQAVTTNNRDEFKNQGFSQIRCFYYGYPEGGGISINSPENNHYFSLRESKTFRWDTPDNLTPNQQYNYDFKIVQVNENQPIEDAINNNSSVYTKQSEILNASNSGYEETVTRNLFESNKQYAWQVKAHTKDQTIASSPIYSCFGPPLIEAFYAGNHTVYVTNTSSANINDLTGEGEVQISYNGATQKVFFEHIKIERQGALLIMTSGHVKAKYDGALITLKADYTPNGNATFEPDSLDIDKEYMRLKGMVNWKFPHATITPQNAYVQSKSTWVIFENYQLIGRTYVKDSLNYELADPYDFTVSLESTSYFLLLNNNNFKLNFNGKTTLPKNIKNASGTNVILPFTNTDKLDYIIQRSNPGSSAIELVRGTGINLLASSYIIDLSESASPHKKSGQKYWKGVYLIRSQLEFPVTPDKTDQLFLKKSPSTL